MTEFSQPPADLNEVRAIEDPTSRFHAASRASDRFRDLSQECQRIRATAIAQLSSAGLSYREIGSQLDLSPQRVAQLMGSVQPASEVMKAWVSIEAQLFELARRNDLGSRGQSRRSVIEALDEAGVLEPELSSSLRDLRALRNTAAHGPAEVSLEAAERATSEAIALSSRLHLLLAATDPGDGKGYGPEDLMRRANSEYPEMDWRQGRCGQCGRAIPIPRDSDEDWVCGTECFSDWRRLLYRFIDPGSEEEAMTRRPSVVPYWT